MVALTDDITFMQVQLLLQQVENDNHLPQRSVESSLKSHSDPIFLFFGGVVVSTVASQQESCGFDNSVFTLYPNLRIKVDDFMALIKS